MEDSYKNFKDYLPYFIIVTFLGVIRFLEIDSFGLYEDDWAFTGNAVTNSVEQNLFRVTSAFATFWQGRPLHMTFLTAIPAIGIELGGLKALFVIGYLILAANACLIYSLFLKVTSNPLLPLLIALFYCAYPADTTYNFIQHLYGIQTSLLLILIAFHLYIRPALRFKNLSYLLATCSLLTYESVFFIFFSAPLLSKENTKKESAIHLLKTFIILIIYSIFRKFSGEERIEDISPDSALLSLLKSVIAGPYVSLRTFLARPLQVLSQLDLVSILWIAFFAFAFFAIISFLIRVYREKNNWTHLKNYSDELRKFFVTGIAMIFLAYPTAITLSVSATDGRASRVHFAAVMGSSLIVSCFWVFLLKLASKSDLKTKVIVFLLSLHLSLLSVFCINVQSAYKLSWNYQQAFWSDILTLAPDLEDNTVILIDSPSLQLHGKQIDSFSWSMPSVLDSIYEFPKTWQNRPRLYLLESQSKNQNFNSWAGLLNENEEFLLPGENDLLNFYYSWEPDRIIDPVNVILIQEENKNLVRKNKLKYDDFSIPLKGAPGVTDAPANIPKSPLFEGLVLYNGLSKTNSVPIYFLPQK